MDRDEALSALELASLGQAIRTEGAHRWCAAVGDGFCVVGDRPDHEVPVGARRRGDRAGREHELLAAMHRHGVDMVPRPLFVLNPETPEEGAGPLIVEERLPGHPVSAVDHPQVREEVVAPVRALLEQLRQVPREDLSDEHVVAEDPAQLLRELVDEDTRLLAAHRDKLAAHNIPDQPFAPILALAGALEPQRAQLIPGALTIDNILFMNGLVSGFTGWRRVMWADPEFVWATLGLSLGTEPENPNQKIYQGYLRISRLIRALVGVGIYRDGQRRSRPTSTMPAGCGTHPPRNLGSRCVARRANRTRPLLLRRIRSKGCASGFRRRWCSR